MGGMARGTFGTILADSVTFGVSRPRNRAEQVTTFSGLARRFHHHHMVNSATACHHRALPNEPREKAADVPKNHLGPDMNHRHTCSDE